MTLPPLQESDLIFSTAHTTSIHKQTSSISKSTLSLPNRLHSIAHDAAFVSDVVSRVGLEDAVIANERCGSWYVDLAMKAGSAYFKSTDGHDGHWNFSCRRLNLGVLRIAGDCGGAVVVDSTRRGKHLPDALSKTLPIWCAVMNRLLFPELGEYHGLVVLSELVSVSEKSRIEARLDEWVENAQRLELPIKSLRSQVRKPLRPRFIVRSLGFHPSQIARNEQNAASDGSRSPFNSLYLLMASTFQRPSHETPDHVLGHSYVQGAGDDAESWAYGLTPEIFWRNKRHLLEANEAELQGLLQVLVGRESAVRVNGCDCVDDLSRTSGTSSPMTVLHDESSSLFIGDLQCKTPEREEDVCARRVLIILVCAEKQIPPRYEQVLREQEIQPPISRRAKRRNILHLTCREGKLGSKDLRNELWKIQRFLEDEHQANNEHEDDTGPDGKNGEPRLQRRAMGTANRNVAEVPDSTCTHGTNQAARQEDQSIPTASRQAKFENQNRNSADANTLIYILSPTSSDLPIGIALAILCLYNIPTCCGQARLNFTTGNADIDGEDIGRGPRPKIDKLCIRKNLAEITSNLASLDAKAVNPSRATLNAVNAFLMSPG